MRYDVHVELAQPRPLAAIRTVTTRERLGADIIASLDVIWPALRAQGVRTGENVVVYHGVDSGTLTVDVGVEVRSEFAAAGEVRPAWTPGGEVATAAHFGEYSKMGGVYAALQEWCASSGRRPAGVSWEVYGDWDEDPARVRTDVFFLLEPTGG